MFGIGIFLLAGDWLLDAGVLSFYLAIAAFALFLSADSVEVEGKRRRIFRWRKVLVSLWTLWVLVTLGTAATLYKSGYEQSWSHVPHAIFNFFTPIYLGNWRVYSFPVMLLGLTGGEWLGKRIKWMAVRVVFNLAILAMLTAMIDTMDWGHWISGVELMDALSISSPSIAMKEESCSASMYLTGPFCSRLPNDYERLYTAIASQLGDATLCEKISSKAVEISGGNLFSTPDVSGERSKCYFWTAMYSRNPKLCRPVKRIIRFGSNSSEVSESGCLALIKDRQYPSLVGPIADPFTIDKLMLEMGYSDETYFVRGDSKNRGDFFWYLLYDAPTEQRQQLFKRVEALPSFSG